MEKFEFLVPKFKTILTIIGIVSYWYKGGQIWVNIETVEVDFTQLLISHKVPVQLNGKKNTTFNRLLSN